MMSPAAHATSAESQQNQQLTRIYAEHIYTSLCAQAYRGEFFTNELSSTDVAQLNNHTLSACKCQYSALAAKNSPSAIIDYVMYVYGENINPEMNDPAAMAYYSSNKISDIGVILDDESIRKKCGFIN